MGRKNPTHNFITYKYKLLAINNLEGKYAVIYNYCSCDVS